MLGYPPGVKGYKLLNLDTKQIFVCRDITFQEHIFPFHSVETDVGSPDFFPDVVLPTVLPETVSELNDPAPVITIELIPHNPAPEIIPAQPLRKRNRPHKPPS
jgi:hypothetical protein